MPWELAFHDRFFFAIPLEARRSLLGGVRLLLALALTVFPAPANLAAVDSASLTL